MATRKYRRYPKGEGWLPLAPKQLPSMSLMLDDIGGSPQAVAKHLGVCRQNVYHWQRDEYAPPRSVQLAVFYETKWGRDFVHTAAHNDAIFYARATVWLEREVARLRSLLERAGQLGNFGAANDPSPDLQLPPTRRELAAAVAALPVLMRRRA